MNGALRAFAYCILVLPMLLVQRAAQDLWGNGPWAVLFFILFYFAVFFIAAVVHEVGHAVVAKRLGWRVCLIAVFPLAYSFETGRFRFWTQSSGDLGGAVVFGARPIRTLSRTAIVIVAGPAFNLCLAAFAIILAQFAPSNSFADFAGSLAMMSLLMGVGNLIPWRARNGSKSDGAILVSLIQQHHAKSRKAAA